MLEMGTSGLMSGDGKRGGFNVSTRVRPRLYNANFLRHRPSADTHLDAIGAVGMRTSASA
jgi:hypothetical protein